MTQKNLKIIQLNSQHKKVANALLTKELVDNNIDVAILQEPYIDCKKNSIPGLSSDYVAYYAGNKATSAIIVRKNLKHIVLSKITTNHLVAVKINTFDKALIFISCYAGRNEDPIPSELDENWPYLKRLSPFIILGVDTNAHSTLLNYNKSDLRATAWEEFLSHRNLVLNNIPSATTFENSRGHVSRIDWTLSTTPASHLLQDWCVPETWITLSDHKIITFVIRACPIRTQKKVFNFKKTNWTLFLEKLDSNLQDDMLDRSLSTENEIEFYTESLSQAIYKTMSDVVPQSKLTHHKNAWWNKKLDEKKREVRRAKREKNVSVYRNLKQEFEEEIFQCKKQSWQKFIQSVENQDDAYLRYKILCKNRLQSSLPPVYDSNEILSTSPEESANILLNQHFPDFEQNPNHDKKISDAVHAYIRTEHTVLEPIIEEHEIRNALRATAPKKSPGIDEIPGLILHKAQNILMPYFLKLFNGIFRTGFYPLSWKNASITFLKKPGQKDSKNPRHYRPISLLPVISKVFERVIQKRLNWFSNSCEWINRRQFGFQRNVGSEFAAWNFSNSIMTNFKRRKETVAIFLDINSAFSRIWHDGLIYKLIKKGVPAPYIKIIHSYVSNRIASVKVDDTNSVSKKLTQSCPQGAVLSPLLFNLFLDDLVVTCSKFNPNIHIQAFADDLVIYMHKDKGQSHELLNQLLQKISEWAKTWHITFNKEKTQAMLFSRLRKPNENLNLVFDGHPIKVVHEYKYLGIMFDSKLSWKQHIKYACSKAKNFLVKLNAVSNAKWGMSNQSCRFLYRNAILPILLYGATVWGNALSTKANLKLYTQTERIALLMITGAFRTSPTNALYVLSGILPIQFVVKERLALGVHNSKMHNALDKRLNIDHVWVKHLDSTTHYSTLEYCMDELRDAGFQTNNIKRNLCPTAILHPASHYPLPITLRYDASTLSQYDHHHLIFTDASKIKDSPVGYAVVQRQQDAWITLLSRQLHRSYSVFDGELRAISSALDYLDDNLLTGNYAICSDSLSSLQTLMNYENLDPIVQNCIQKWHKLRLRNCQVKFYWVPAHTGIEGNEAADAAAKEATTIADESQINSLFVDRSMLKKHLREMSLKRWNSKWYLENTIGRFTHSIFPKVNTSPPFSHLDSRYDQVLLNRAATGHFPINYYLCRFKLREANNCPYCGKIETIEHTLVDCNFFALTRFEYLRLLDLVQTDLTVSDYFRNKKLNKLALIILKKRLNYLP